MAGNPLIDSYLRDPCMRLALSLSVLAGALLPGMAAAEPPQAGAGASPTAAGAPSVLDESVSVSALPSVASAQIGASTEPAPVNGAAAAAVAAGSAPPVEATASTAGTGAAASGEPAADNTPTGAAAPAATAASPLPGDAAASPAAAIPADPAAAVAPATAAAPATGEAPGNGASAAPVAEPLAAAAPAVVDKDLWSRIRRGFKMTDLDTKRAQASTRWYAAKPDYIARMTGRASMYLYHIVDELEKRGMPTELALLPFVESAMQPEAVSFAQAAGLWQFIPSTGRLYSLEQNLWKDERFGVIESTRAALDYLQKLYAEFGDWQLALAAYNCGEAGVERALARARAAHRSVAYKDLRLPNETQYYVPKLQAIKNIIADPQRFGIELPAIRNEPYFVAVSKTQDMDVTTAARLAELPLEDFRALNPAFNRPVIVGASSPTILVPADHADTFNANLAAWRATGQPLASWTAYTLQPGEALGKLAERVGVTEAQLREANHIPPRYRPAAGSTILVPREEGTNDDIAPGFITASFSLVPESGNLHQVSYRVRRGDTLASVARRWHVSSDDIVAWNQLHSSTLFTGQHLTLTVARPAVAAPHKVSKKAAPAAAPATHAVAAARATTRTTATNGAISTVAASPAAGGGPPPGPPPPAPPPPPQ
jgi:membrane-bound lytic murein transglycosylase D